MKMDDNEKEILKQKSLWQEIVTSENTKKDLEQSHLFIFGEKNAGKKSIIKTINNNYLLNKYEGNINSFILRNKHKINNY
jgi:hypothetical protein